MIERILRSFEYVRTLENQVADLTAKLDAKSKKIPKDKSAPAQPKPVCHTQKGVPYYRTIDDLLAANGGAS